MVVAKRAGLLQEAVDEVEAKAREYLDRIDAMGGAVAAIEAGFQMDEIESLGR